MHKRACAAFLLACSASAAHGQEIGISTGANYSTGHYGAPARTEIVSTHIGLDATYSGWRLDATLPYLIVSSPGGPIDAGGVVVPAGPGTTSGLGDLTLRLERSVQLSSSSPFEIIVAAQLKVPTGASTLSTGQLDALVEAELSWDLGNFAPYLSVGYSMFGDSVALPLSDGWAASAGSAFTLGGVTLIGSYEWAESPLGLPSTHELFGVAAGSFKHGWGWFAYGSKGLSSGAPDLLVGLGITRSLGGGGSVGLKRLPR